MVFIQGKQIVLLWSCFVNKFLIFLIPELGPSDRRNVLEYLMFDNDFCSFSLLLTDQPSLPSEWVCRRDQSKKERRRLPPNTVRTSYM